MTHPTPPWTVLREHAPEILDDFVDLWARLDTHTISEPTRHSRELRWLIEHLAALVEDHLVTSANTDPYDQDDWDGDYDVDDWDDDDDDLIGLVTL